jgi:bifunctional DNA-binding transcriptional regulator/antitoxin component of YhaV-PrlF toxin-antitoxin module
VKATFKTKLTGTATSPTGIEVPPKVIETLGSAKRPSVVVTINGTFSYRTTVGVMSGKFMIPVSAERRKEANIKAGDPIEVTVEMDTAERTVEIPADLAIALGKNKKVKAAFDKLAYSHQKEHVRAVEDAKKPETRAARIERIITALSK